jgi:hypothetical protein
VLAAAVALEVAVLTMTPGAELFARFGHTALRVVDGAGHVRIYNYGAFNGADPQLGRKFLENRIEYFLGAVDWEQFASRYASRTVTGQVLALDDGEADRLIRRLEETARPENRGYRYDWFRNNCTTKVRDILDETLGGALKAELARQPSGRTIRNTLEGALWSVPSLYSFFSLTLNRRVDEPLSRWDALDMPGDLMRGLRTLRRADGRPLVAEEWAWQGAAPRPRREPGWLLPSLAGLLLMLLAAGAVGRGPRARVAGGLGLAAWGLGSGLVALWCLVMWSLPYPDTDASANLIAYSPLALFEVPLAAAFARGRLPANGRRLLGRLLEALMVLAALEMAGHVLGLGRQQHLVYTVYALAAMGLGRLTLKRHTIA